MNALIRVALTATTEPWRPALAEHIRDHVADMTATTVRDPKVLRCDQRGERRGRRFDVVVLDDVMRIFSAADVGGAQDRGTRFVGLFDALRGRGQPYLVDLGVDLILPTASDMADLLAAVRHLCPVDGLEGGEDEAPRVAPAAAPAAGRGGGRVTVQSRVCGGVGSTETAIALAASLARRGRTLLIECDELAPSAAGRLGRDPDCGLARALGRVAHGHRALPEGLSPRARGPEGFAADVICGTALPGGPPLMNPADLLALVDEAVRGYDEVLVETNLLIASSSDLLRDRFAAARAVLRRADRVVVLARPDGDGAMRLVQWVAAARAAGAAGPAWAVFGRVPRARSYPIYLGEVLRTHLPPGAFQGVRFLPEDAAVGKAKWNGELVRGGRWRAEVDRLGDSLLAWSPPSPLDASAAPRPGRRRRAPASGVRA